MPSLQTTKDRVTDREGRRWDLMLAWLKGTIFGRNVVPSLQTIKDRVTDLEGRRWDLMLARQATYLAANGRYWQGLLTHIVAPSHDDRTDDARESDRQTDRPTNQAESWLMFWPEIQGRLLSKALRCNVYDGPQGQGFTISAEFRHDGILYERARNHGPETHRTHDWQIVSEVIGTSVSNRKRGGITNVLREWFKTRFKQ